MRNKLYNLPYEARQIFLYMLIGDGSLQKTGVLRMKHSHDQIEYLLWKRDLLESYGIKTRMYSQVCHSWGKDYLCDLLDTRLYIFSKIYRKLIYRPNKQIYFNSLLRTITPLGIAIWYMDDGNLYLHKRDNDRYYPEITLATCVDYDTNDRIRKMFSERFGIESKIRPVCYNKPKNVKTYNPNNYLLKIENSKYSVKFINLVTPTISQIPSMKYKIDLFKYYQNDKNK